MSFTLLHDKKENKKRKKERERTYEQDLPQGLYQNCRCCRHERCDRRRSGRLQCRLRLCFRFHFRCCRSVYPRHLRGHCRGYLLHRQGHHDLLRQRCHRRGGGHLRRDRLYRRCRCRRAARAAAGCRLCRDRRRFWLYYHLRCRDEGRQELLCTGQGRGCGLQRAAAHR